MKRILVLCTGNSARSQMAQGYLQAFAGNRAEVYSAGVAPHGVNPLSVQVMAEDGIDISHHTSNHVDEYADIHFDHVITVCDNAREQCPYFPSAAELIYQSFPDPGHQPGVDALTSFRDIRDQIKAFSQNFVDSKLADQPNIKIRLASANDRETIKIILKYASLPISDLPESLSHFLVADVEGQIVGVSGLEMFGKIGLLRSVAVDPAFQKNGIAEKLIQNIKKLAEDASIQDIYLITNTADQYFLRHGFNPIGRNQAPEAIQRTGQFSGLCPASSVVMLLNVDH